MTSHQINIQVCTADTTKEEFMILNIDNKIVEEDTKEREKVQMITSKSLQTEFTIIINYGIRLLIPKG